MTLQELATLVLAMRNAQRAFFLNRRVGDLNDSKRLEKELDAAVRDILDNTPSLFDERGTT